MGPFTVFNILFKSIWPWCAEKKIKSRNMTIKTLGRRKELPARRRSGEGCGTEAGLIARRGLAARLRLATANGLGL